MDGFVAFTVRLPLGQIRMMWGRTETVGFMGQKYLLKNSIGFLQEDIRMLLKSDADTCLCYGNAIMS